MSSSFALNSLLGSTSSTGLDISSLLQAAFGSSSSGINVSTAVSAAVSAARQPENAWQSQETVLQNQNAALTQLQAQTTALESDLTTLDNAIGPMAARSVTSSNSTVISGMAAAGAALGNHTISVTSLATTASWVSNSVASPATALGSGAFSITSSSGTTASFTTGGTTLTALAGQINAAGLDVTATVITDANGSRLAITSDASGLAANFTVSATPTDSVQFSQASTGSNASLLVDGIQVNSASNSVSGVLPGVTLDLLNASPGTNVSVSIAPDTSQASSAITQFVSDFNAVIKSLNSQFTFNGSSEGPLASDSVIRALQSDLLSSLNYTYTPPSGTTTISNLSSLGISVQNDGTLAIDNTTLTDALQNKFSDVQSFFQGAAFNGFAQSLNSQLLTFLNPAQGAFTVDLQSLKTQYSGLQTNIKNFESNYIVPLQTRLQNDYSHAEILLQQLPKQLNQINAMLGQNSSSRNG